MDSGLKAGDLVTIVCDGFPIQQEIVSDVTKKTIRTETGIFWKSTGKQLGKPNRRIS